MAAVNSSMPSFIYPQNMDSSASTPTFLLWNYLDTVNVSWAPSNLQSENNYQVQLLLYWASNNSDTTLISNETVPVSGSKTYPLNVGTAYPSYGLFELAYLWPNGTKTTGPDSQYFNVTQNSNATPRTWTAPSGAESGSGSSSSSSHTSTPTSTPPLTSHSLSPGAIAGIAVGAVAALALLAALAFFLLRRHRARKAAAYTSLHQKDAQIANIYASAQPYSLGTEVKTDGNQAADQGAPRRGRFREMLMSITSPRELSAPGPRHLGVAIGEPGMPDVEREGWGHRGAAELPVGGWSPVEMDAGR